MDWLTEPFSFANGQRALLAAVLIGFTNGYASAFVVMRRAALQISSISHSLLPGIAIAVLIAGLTQASAFLGAAIAALITGLISLFVSRTSRVDHDTALAVLFTTAFSAGVLILHYINIPNELEHWLFGNILGMADADLWTAFTISAVTLTTLTCLGRPLVVMLFEPDIAAASGIPVRPLSYLLFALLILVLVSSLQAVGCILAIGLLVTPAATVYLFCDSPQTLTWGGGILGAAASALALVLSYWLDLPAGSMIVIVLGSIFALAYIASPRYGLLRRLLPSRHQHH